MGRRANDACRAAARRLADWWRRRPGPVAAAVCLVVTVWAVLMHQHTSFAKEWMPHIAAGAATIGLTVTVVDLILRREAEERLRPRRERVLNDITLGFWQLFEIVTQDYTETHVRSFRAIPREPLAFLDQWLEQQPEEDDERQTLGAPHLLGFSDGFVTLLRSVRASDLDVIPPRLVRAIDDFVRENGEARFWWREKASFHKLAPFEHEGDYEQRVASDRTFALRATVAAIRRFTEVLTHEHPPARDVPERIADSAMSLHYAIMRSH